MGRKRRSSTETKKRDELERARPEKEHVRPEKARQTTETKKEARLRERDHQSVHLDACVSRVGNMLGTGVPRRIRIVSTKGNGLRESPLPYTGRCRH